MIVMKKIIFFVSFALSLQYATAQISIDRSKQPKAGPAPVISIADPAIFTLPNGMTVLVVENHKLPKISVSLNIDAGPITEGTKAGVMQLMGQMLEEGTQTMPKAKFDEAIDLLGANIGLSSNGGSTSALTKYFDKAFTLFTDAIKNPAFAQESFDKLKQLNITALKANEKSAAAISGRVVNALAYGKQSPMGEFQTAESIKALTLNDVQEVYKKYITPSRSYLTFVGDITPAQAKKLVTKAFGNWTGKKLTLPAIVNVNNPTTTEIDFIDVPTAVQAEIRVGNLVNNPLSSPDYFTLTLANAILGGGANGKLFLNLREKHGFTYGSYSSVGKGRFQSQFMAEAAVRTEKADSAVVEMLNEIKNMREGKITQEELNIAKAIYNGSFALQMESPATAASYASSILINNLPKDFYRTFLQKINAVTIADLQRVSQKYFNYTNTRIVMVGNGSKILPNLSRLGYPVKLYDQYANPTTGAATKTDGVSAQSIIERYLKAIGGKEAALKINTVYASSTMSMMGQEMTALTKKMSGGKSYTEMKMGDMVLVKVAFDGSKGYQMQMGVKKDFDADEIKEQLDDKTIIPQLLYDNAEYKTEYLGNDKVGEEDVYKLKVTKPSGKTIVEYYSTKTGFLIREEFTKKQKGKEIDVNVTSDRSNYQQVGGIWFPFTIIQTVGEMTINNTIKEVKINEGITEADFK